ncbi:MAG: hypothetical protein ABI321_21515 [Polyangia bacterium]
MLLVVSSDVALPTDADALQFDVTRTDDGTTLFSRTYALSNAGESTRVGLVYRCLAQLSTPLRRGGLSEAPRRSAKQLPMRARITRPAKRDKEAAKAERRELRTMRHEALRRRRGVSSDADADKKVGTEPERKITAFR